MTAAETSARVPETPAGFNLILVSQFDADKLDALVPQWRYVLGRGVVRHLIRSGWVPPVHVLEQDPSLLDGLADDVDPHELGDYL